MLTLRDCYRKHSLPPDESLLAAWLINRRSNDRCKLLVFVHYCTGCPPRCPGSFRAMADHFKGFFPGCTHSASLS